MSYTISVKLTPTFNPNDIFFTPDKIVSNPIKDWAKDQVQDAIMGALEAIQEVLVELSYSVALVGGGVCILLWLSGWRNGARWSGILFMAHVLINFLLGGW